MRISLKSFVAPVALAFALGVYGQAFAQDRPDSPSQRPDSPSQQPARPDAPARPEAPGAQAQASATAQGELLDVDAKASTITVKSSDNEMKFKDRRSNQGDGRAEGRGRLGDDGGLSGDGSVQEGRSDEHRDEHRGSCGEVEVEVSK